MLNRTWERAIVLLLGAILAPGKRTVSSVLSITGRRRERRFQNYHRVLNRAAWDLRQGSAGHVAPRSGSAARAEAEAERAVGQIRIPSNP